MDTIFALATALGRAGVAVVRVSGPEAIVAMGDFIADVPENRAVRAVRARDGQLLDHALVLTFRGGASFTGEDVVELHLHGSPAVVSAVLKELGQHPSLRMAEAGEFTRRAFENGRLDLAQVEGLADLIDAETEAQRRQALQVFSGALGQRAEIWRKQLLRATALLEAMIDFADEEVPEDTTAEVSEILRGLADAWMKELEGVKTAERVRQGFDVAIVGEPNVGKSTLLNRIAGRDAAIVSEVAGTTRDVIEVRCDLDGLPVTFLDTAGMRDSIDAVERIGIERARMRADQADLRVHLVLGDGKPTVEVREGDIVAVAKADLGAHADFAVSGETGQGVDALVARVQSVLGDRVSGVGVAMRERHRIALDVAVARLNVAMDGLALANSGIDVISEDLRSAGRAIDSLVGRIDVEDVLGEIFSSFCIGK